MHFGFTEEQEGFRREVRDFCAQPEVQQAINSPAEEGEVWPAYSAEFHRLLAAKGWLGLHWPTSLGGQDRGFLDIAIFNEEMGYARAPMRAYLITVGVAANTIMAFGSPDLKANYLPRISRGEILFCQGFSEPEAGSDVASIQTRAVRNGENYVVTGQKIFTSHAHLADYCLLLARTDLSAPKHRGLSLFVVDMKSSGLTVQPLWNLGGGRVNMLFFDQVVVPATNLVGEENRGFHHAMTSLNFERSSTMNIGLGQRTLEELVEYARSTSRDGRPLSEDPSVRQRLARLATDLEVGRLLAYRVAWLQNQDRVPDYEASMAKVHSTELLQRLSWTGMLLLGPYGQIQAGSPWAPLRGTIEGMYRYTVSSSITAGTSEIQRNIIALKGLNLPR